MEINKETLTQLETKDVPELPRQAVRVQKFAAGVDLARILLFMIGGFIVLSIAVWVLFEIRSGNAIAMASHDTTVSVPVSSPSPLQVQTPVEKLWEDRIALRRFWLEVFEKVLLQALIPLLAAVFGYTFGTHQSRSRET
jgi:hypothetical protein